MFERAATGERAVLVRIGVGTRATAEDLEEFTALATRPALFPSRVSVAIGQARSALFRRQRQGTGVCDVASAHSADVVLVDHPLSPSQERNLEELTRKRVLDRSGLILDIFAQRARSFEGKLQVELAQLKHLQTRLVRGWTHLERQKAASACAVPVKHSSRPIAAYCKAHPNAPGPPREARAPARNGPPGAQGIAGSDRRDRRLHQRRQIDVVQRADGRWYLCRRPSCSRRSIPLCAACSCSRFATGAR